MEGEVKITIDDINYQVDAGNNKEKQTSKNDGILDEELAKYLICLKQCFQHGNDYFINLLVCNRT